MSINITPRCIATNGSGSASSLAITWPTDSTAPQAGDILVVAVTLTSNSSSSSFGVTNSSGAYSTIKTLQGATPTRALSGAWFWRVCASGESNPTVTFGLTTSANVVGMAFYPTDLDTSSWDNTNEDQTNVNAAAASQGTGSATCTNASGLGLALCMADLSQSLNQSSSGWDGSWTQQHISATSASRAGLTIASQAFASSGSKSGTYTPTTSDEMWGSIAIVKGAAAAAPVLTSVGGSGTGSTTADGNVTTDTGSGTMYAIVTTNSQEPSVAQIQAGNDQSGSAAPYATNVAISSTGVKNFSATGLTANTAYYWFFQHNANSQNSTLLRSSIFYTTSGPALTAPTGTGTSTSTATGSVSTDTGNGTLYAILTTNGNTPSAAQLKAGNDQSGNAATYSTSQSLSSSGTKNFSASNLAAGTTYYWYWIQTDSGSVDSSIVNASLSTSTTATIDPVPLHIGTRAGTGSASSLITVLGTTATANNLLITYICVTQSGRVFTAPTGFTLIDSSSSGNQSAAWAYKKSDGTETGCTWNIPSSGGGYANILEFKAQGLVVPYVLNGQGSNSDSVGTIFTGTTGLSSGSATNTQDNGLCLAFFGFDFYGLAATSGAYSSSFTERDTSDPANTSRGGYSIASKRLTTAAANATTYTHTNATGSAAWASIVNFKGLSSAPLATIATVATITSGSTCVITGTNFGSSQGTGAVTLNQGSRSHTCTISSWGPTSITINVPTVTSSVLKIGTANTVITISPQSFQAVDSSAQDFNATSAYNAVDMAAPRTIASNRLDSTTTDLAVGDQILVDKKLWNAAHDSESAIAVTVATDGGFTIPNTTASGVYTFDYYVYDNSNGVWSSSARQTINMLTVALVPVILASLAILL